MERLGRSAASIPGYALPKLSRSSHRVKAERKRRRAGSSLSHTSATSRVMQAGSMTLRLRRTDAAPSPRPKTKPSSSGISRPQRSSRPLPAMAQFKAVYSPPPTQSPPAPPSGASTSSASKKQAPKTEPRRHRCSDNYAGSLRPPRSNGPLPSGLNRRTGSARLSASCTIAAVPPLPCAGSPSQTAIMASLSSSTTIPAR